MADYLPLYPEDEAITRKASATITGGQLVRVSGDGTVAPVSAASADWLGVAGHDAVNGQQVTVWIGGVQRIPCVAAITAGALVEGGASGQVNTHTPSIATPVYVNVVGLALSTTTAPGQLVEVNLVR
jgi:hypothetical protein